MGCSKSSPKWEVYSNTVLPQKTRKTSDNLTLHLKQLEKEHTQKNTPKLVEGKRHKDLSRNKWKKKMKETVVKINKTKSWFFEKIKLTNL